MTIGSIITNGKRLGRIKQFGIATALFAAGVLTVLAVTNASTANAANTCDKVNVVYCGVPSIAQFQAIYKSNKSGHDSSPTIKHDYTDLHTIYGAFGVTPQLVASMDSSNTKTGVVHRDGRVEIGGKVVGTDAMVAARFSVSGSTHIAGTNAYIRHTTDSFLLESRTVLIRFDDNGKMLFAIETDCGNPIMAKPVVPIMSCDLLQMINQANRTTFTFKTTATAKNGALVTAYGFDFGDGQTKTSNSATATHTYAKPGNYTIKASVTVTANGMTKTITAPKCNTTVTVKPEAPKPVYACTALDARKLKDNQYEFTAAAQVAGGATLRNADFTFGDGQSAQGIKPKDATHVTIPHEYAKEGSYIIVATLHFNVGQEVKDVKCQKQITINADVCAINPSLPKNSPDCKPCALNPNLPFNSPDCKPPTTPPATPPATPTPPELPSTGLTDAVGSSVGFGGIVAAGSYYVRTRRDLLATMFKR